MKLFSLILLPVIFFTFACGIKGDPLPPEKPPELGRGKPTYKRAVEGLKYDELPEADFEDEEEDDDDEDD